MATFNHFKDILIVCPYDKTHKIAARNRIKHIIECEKTIVSQFSVCIYNASHRMARNEFAHHIKSCPDGRHQIRELLASTSGDSSVADSASDALTTCATAVSDSEDEWANDNCPDYSIFGEFTTNNKSNSPEGNPSQKLTKNQKKRNRRKAAKEVNVKSIWD